MKSRLSLVGAAALLALLLSSSQAQEQGKASSSSSSSLIHHSAFSPSSAELLIDWNKTKKRVKAKANVCLWTDLFGLICVCSLSLLFFPLSFSIRNL